MKINLSLLSFVFALILRKWVQPLVFFLLYPSLTISTPHIFISSLITSIHFSFDHPLSFTLISSIFLTVFSLFSLATTICPKSVKSVIWQSAAAGIVFCNVSNVMNCVANSAIPYDVKRLRDRANTTLMSSRFGSTATATSSHERARATRETFRGRRHTIRNTFMHTHTHETCQYLYNTYENNTRIGRACGMRVLYVLYWFFSIFFFFLWPHKNVDDLSRAHGVTAQRASGLSGRQMSAGPPPSWTSCCDVYYYDNNAYTYMFIYVHVRARDNAITRRPYRASETDGVAKWSAMFSDAKFHYCLLLLLWSVTELASSYIGQIAYRIRQGLGRWNFRYCVFRHFRHTDHRVIGFKFLGTQSFQVKTLLSFFRT